MRAEALLIAVKNCFAASYSLYLALSLCGEVA